MIPLKLTEPSDDLKIPPEQLFHKLLHSAGHLDNLLNELHCSPDDLAETLTDPRTINLLRLKAQLATMQVKLLAIHYMPHAMAQTIKLTEAEKPEVARRCCNTIINMAGVPTETKSQPPTLSLHKHEEVANEELTPEEKKHHEFKEGESKRLLTLMAFSQSIQNAGVDIDAVKRCDSSKLAQVLNDLLTEEGIPSNLPKSPFPW